MKKSSSKTSGSKSSAHAAPDLDLQAMAEEVIKYIEDKAKNIDKATLAKYVGVAILVLYGLRKSNILGSLAMSVITGMVAKYVSDMMEGKAEASTSSK
jgi:hypothetical protein